MKIRITVTAAEMMSIQSMANLFNDEPMMKHKHEIIEELNQHTSERTTYNEDGSCEIEFSSSEIFTISVTNWLRDIIGQTKSLILGAVDTYKNLTKMMGLKRLIIDGKEVENVCKNVKTKMYIDDMKVVVETHPDQKVSDKEEQQRVTEKITAALKQPVTE